MKTMFSFLGFLVLLWLAPFGHTCDEHQKEECSYTLTVKTSCLYRAGTENHVRMMIGDYHGTEICSRHLSEPIEGDKDKPFQTCKTAKFKIGGPCFKSPACRVQFFVQGTDKLRISRAILERENGTEPDQFSIHKKIAENAWDGKDYCSNNPQLASFQAKNYDNDIDSEEVNKVKKPDNNDRRCLRGSGRKSGKAPSGKNGGKAPSRHNSDDGC